MRTGYDRPQNVEFGSCIANAVGEVNERGPKRAKNRQISTIRPPNAGDTS